MAQHPENEQRGLRAYTAIKAHLTTTEHEDVCEDNGPAIVDVEVHESFDENVTSHINDLLTDLMHYCDSVDVSFEDRLFCARDNHSEELLEPIA